jgi:Retrotransposon gag protein
MAQPTLEQVVQILWAERTQTQAQNQQLQQQLSQIRSEVHSQAIIQASAQDFKYKPSTPDSFSGADSKLEGWIDQVELHMDLARMPRRDDIFRLAVAKQFLGEDVRRWTRMQHDVSGLADLKEMMRVYYKVPNNDKNIRDNLNKLRQTGSVAEYTNRFYHLVLQVEEMSQADQVFHFVKGLNANVKLEVEKEWVKTPGMSITQMK